MTRETKIGLLVGLCFIIVIGILLSDHLSTSEAPQPAPLNLVAKDVRTGTNIPAAAEAPMQPTAVVPMGFTPRDTVATKSDPKPGSAIIEINGGQPPVTTVKNNQIAMETKNIIAPQGDGLAHPPVIDAQPPISGGRLLTDLSKEKDTEIVPVSDKKAGPTTNPTAIKTLNSKEYKADDGDTVSRMARKFYGNASKSNCDLIINANAALKANPHKIIVGKTYLIPTIEKPTLKLSESALNSLTPTTKPALAEKTEPKTPSSTAYRSYTVKDNDNLYKIAMKELGTSNWQQIQDLNKDVLKGSDRVKPGMTLKIPAKQVAIASH